MFWRRNKNKKIIIKLEVTEDKDIVSIDIDKGISTERYFTFVNSLLGNINIVQACDKLEMNGETEVYAKFKEQLYSKYINDLQAIIAYTVPQASEKAKEVDEEVIKPSQGII